MSIRAELAAALYRAMEEAGGVPPEVYAISKERWKALHNEMCEEEFRLNNEKLKFMEGPIKPTIRILDTLVVPE